MAGCKRPTRRSSGQRGWSMRTSSSRKSPRGTTRRSARGVCSSRRARSSSSHWRGRGGRGGSAAGQCARVHRGNRQEVRLAGRRGGCAALDGPEAAHRTGAGGEVEGAARLVNAHEFIAEIAKRYDSQVGEGGVQLSTGQKQLIALARAV